MAERGDRDLVAFRSWCRQRAVECLRQADALSDTINDHPGQLRSALASQRVLERDAQLWTEQADAVDRWLSGGLEQDVDEVLADLFTETVTT